MIKTTLLCSLLFLFLGCGNSSDSGSSNASNDYGSNLLPEIPPLQDEYAPQGLSDKVFVKSGLTYGPMDFLAQALTMTFDPVSQTTSGHSLIKFRVKKSGRPYFELKATAMNVKLDSSAVSVSSIADPDVQSQTYISVDQSLTPGEIHQLEFDYDLAAGRVSFVDGGVRFLTDMTDLVGKFFEYWGPVGFEEDSFAMNLELRVENSQATHTLYTNGKITSSDSQAWRISFPNFFSKSSFYVHLTNQVLPSKTFVYKGLTKDIPVQVYGLTSALVNSAVSALPKLFAELEGDYGSYPHDSFLAYMNDRTGGMEYVGATITVLGSIDHELLHSWFGRSVIPADGRSGWIDEAMASWRDYGYTKASTLLQRTPTNLADFSPYKKNTPGNSYVDGRGLMAELDRLFASFGGMKPIMKDYFQRYKNKMINNEEFWKYLAEHTKIDMEPYNTRYALGSSNENDPMAEEALADQTPRPSSKHPAPLTEEEIMRLR